MGFVGDRFYFCLGRRHGLVELARWPSLAPPTARVHRWAFEVRGGRGNGARAVHHVYPLPINGGSDADPGVALRGQSSETGAVQ